MPKNCQKSAASLHSPKCQQQVATAPLKVAGSQPLVPLLSEPARLRLALPQAQYHAGTITITQPSPVTVKICSATFPLVRSHTWSVLTTAADRSTQSLRVQPLGGVA
ncbi:hypothetical protein [Stenomitos frigidus]|uniref:Uncharacterized protein n=1 Tax=Stenomitos frigidus ULC18 TaxID=2107698 RepID=A0A2T1DUQ4_9CYAN|nr:hypothetical protein [Stenomitos frigidus]PSB24225.1 hypothetical protein C7B82_27880 [Stenomitos frigidus ULC18]